MLVAAAVFLAAAVGDIAAQAQTLAFPGAEGFGRFASGGRGGDVYIVTNLNDSGPGSFREAVTNRAPSTPRTVVFAVSGTIYLNSTLRIAQGDLTIAGQTAPGDGICLARYPLNPSGAGNVIIRFIRSRLGDTMLVEDDAFVCRYATDVIVDHCSFSWSVDETASAYDNARFTLQWCFVTESLRDSVHTKGPHGYGGIWGGLGASFHHNLMAHHDSRNPRFNGARTHGTDGELVDMRNNVIYNWRGNSTYGGEPTDTGLPSRQNMVNNYYKNGPATGTGAIRYRILEPTENPASTGSTFGLFHVAGNHTTGSATVSADNWAGGVQAVTAAQIAALRAPDAHTVAPVVTQTALEAYPLVLGYGGCRRPNRDTIDARIAGEVENGTATHRGSKGNLAGIIDSQADVGGWPALVSASAPADNDLDGMPDAWETAHDLDPALASDRNLVDAATGYTQLELYLNELAAPAFPVPSFSTQPQPRTVDVGASFTLSAVASAPAGTGPLSYQWYRYGAVIAGVTTASYSVAEASAADAGDYRVLVNNSYGSIASATVAVVVSAQPPAIVSQPVSTTVAAGEDVTFTVGATGTPTLSYQWYRGADAIPGATAASLTLADVTVADAGSYHAVVSNAYGSAPSDTATLAVTTSSATRVFSTDFTQDTIHAQTPVVNATRTNWYVMASKVATASSVGDDPATTGVIETRPFTLALNSATTSGVYQAATVFSAAPLDLGAVGGSLRATVTFSPRNISTLGFGLFNSGGVLPHTSHANGSGATPGVTDTLLGGTADIAGGTQGWLGYRGALFGSGTPVAQIVSRSAQTSAPTTNRTQELVIPGTSASYANPVGTTVGTSANSSATNVVFTDDATYTLVYEIGRAGADVYDIAFRLYQGTDTGASGVVVFSSTTSTTADGTTPSAVTSAFDSFAFGARTTNGTVVPRLVLTSFSVDHIVPATTVSPAITTQPAARVVSRGSAFTLDVEASGSPAPSFQWYRDDTAISGATANLYTVDAARDADAGTYTVVATNSAGSATSHPVSVTVLAPYDTWCLAHGLDPVGNGAPAASPSGDGVPNLLKFALGGDPAVSGSTLLPTLRREGAGYAFTYDVKTVALEDHVVGAEYSSDLANWTAAVSGQGGVGVEIVALDASTDRVTVGFSAATDRLFVRLRVAAKP